MQEHASEVARIQEQIAAEQMAAKLALHGPSVGTGRHAFITARQERIGVLHEQLENLVGDQALALVVETCDNVPDVAIRSELRTVLRLQLGESAETDDFCHRLERMWETVDMLEERFGMEQAHKIILAPSSPNERERAPVVSRTSESLQEDKHYG